jgi:hypothetical protein
VEEEGWGCHGPKTGRGAIEEEEERQNGYLISIVFFLKESRLQR